MAKAYHRIGELEKARDEARKGAEVFPRQARFPGIGGHIVAAEDLSEEAIEYNLRALELETRNVDAWHNMGLTHLEAGRPTEAIRCFEKALSLEDRETTRWLLEQAYEISETEAERERDGSRMSEVGGQKSGNGWMK